MSPENFFGRTPPIFALQVQLQAQLVVLVSAFVMGIKVWYYSLVSVLFAVLLTAPPCTAKVGARK